MNIGAKHSLCLISMLSKMQPSESIPTKNSLVGLKSRNTCAGSLIEFRRKVGGQIVVESNRISPRCDFQLATSGFISPFGPQRRSVSAGFPPESNRFGGHRPPLQPG